MSMMPYEGLGASPDGDRATAVEPVPVSPLRDGIPSACKRLFSWAGAAGMLIVGIMMAVAGGAAMGQDISSWSAWITTAVATFVILGAIECFETRAVSKVERRWAMQFADMIAKDHRTEIRVEHAFQSIRPELDEIIAREVAQAIEARSGETAQQARSGTDESAVGIADAPKTTDQQAGRG